MRAAPILTAVLVGAATFLAQAQPGPTDPQIAHIVVTANQVDIDAGKLAEKKGPSERGAQVRQADGDRPHLGQQVRHRAGRRS